jgi:hypothetical protein
VNDLVTGPHAGSLRDRTLGHENFCDDRIEEKPFALQSSDEAEFLVCGMAGMREDEQEHNGDSDPCGNLSEHIILGPNEK